ncbi:hypothetical protein ECANGB1_2132 [Enterospora canceri]|uniref:SUN domain-containing protein n=1 Tax=Enterospora canceri TaxID=1081671 RepID=A0A1Y1S5R5_9MICR|nr:hypothetical protein ECANGB1_2132 [Enterospora canceri]
MDKKDKIRMSSLENGSLVYSRTDRLFDTDVGEVETQMPRDKSRIKKNEKNKEILNERENGNRIRLVTGKNKQRSSRHKTDRINLDDITGEYDYNNDGYGFEESEVQQESNFMVAWMLYTYNLLVAVYNTVRKYAILILLVAFYYKTTGNAPTQFTTNICTITNARVEEISRLYRFGLFRSRRTSIDNLIQDNPICTSLEMPSQKQTIKRHPYIKISLNKRHHINTIAIYHPIQANKRSAIHRFTLQYVRDNRLVQRELIYKDSYGYQEYQINESIDWFKIRINSNYGEKYVSIYRIFAHGR